MKIKESYPVFVTKRLTATKDFYVKWFKFEVFFESTWFILLQAKSDRPYYVAFMDESHPTSPPTLPAINATAGVFLTLEVEDAALAYEELAAAGIAMYYPLKEEQWGQKRFGLIDPNEMYVDIVEQIAPEEGYWDKYMITSL